MSAPWPIRLSSIFSFKSLSTVRPSIPTTLLGVFIVLLSFELVCRALPGRWLSDPFPPQVRMNAALDEPTKAALRSAETVILGTSRAAFGISPGMLARELRLGPDRVVNLGYPGLYGEDLHEMFRRATEIGGPLRTLIVSVDEYFLAAEAMNLSRFLDLQFTFRDRIRWLWYHAGVALHLRPPLSLDVWYRTHDGMFAYRGSEDQSYPDDGPAEPLAAVADEFLKTREIDLRLIAPYARIAEEAKARGIKTVFVVLPSHPVFTGALHERYGTKVAETYEAFDELAARSGGAWKAFTPKDCAMPVSGRFRDAIHLTPAGAREFSRCLGRYMDSRS